MVRTSDALGLSPH